MKLLKSLTVGVVAVAAIALSVATASAASYTFTAPDLTVGSRGQAVQQLQVLLNSDANTQIATSGAGSPGMETTYFGNLTKVALAKFQAEHGITPAAGYFGAKTRAFVNSWTGTGTVTTTIPGCTAGALFSSTTGQSCSGTGTVVTSTGGISASLAADNTPATSIAAGSATAELARFVFSGTGTVTNVTLQRIGLSTNNSTLQNVYLYNGATRLTDSGSVSSNGTITFNSPSGLFTVNGSEEVTVRADLVPVAQGGATSGTVGVELTGYTGNAVSASAALSGNQMTIVNVQAATATFSNPVTNPSSGATVNAGTTNYTVWSNQIAVSTRAINLDAATFKFIGSAPVSSLQNIELYVDGSQISTGVVTSITGSSYIVFNLSSTPYTLTTGSHTLEVRADVVGGSSFTFQVSLQNAADLMLADSQLPGTFASASGIPTYTTGNQVLISGGTNSVTVDPAFNTTTITGGATNVPIAQYKFTGYGEDVKITSLNVTPSISGATPGGQSLNNVSLYANGAQIGSTQNYSGSGTLTFNLGSSLIVPAGSSTIVTVRADIINATSTNYTAGNLSVGLSAATSNAQGMSSQALSTIPASTITSNTLTIGTNTLTVAQNAALTNQSVSPNTAGTRIGSYVIQAGSSEGLQVTNLTVAVQSAAGGGIQSTPTNLANLYVVVNGTQLTPQNPQASNNFSTNFSIPTSSSVTVDVYADVGALTGYASTTLAVTGRGLVSNVSATTGAIAGQNITIATGGVANAPTIVSSATLPSQYIIGPSSPSIATYNFVSTSTNATIQELKFTVTSSVANAVSKVTISANGSTASAVPVNGVADIAGLNINVPAGYGGVNVVVTPTYSTVGGVNGIASNSTVTTSLTYIKSNSGNQSTIVTPLNVTSPAMTLVSSKPTLSIASPNVTLQTGLTEVADITVSADANGAINVNNLPITVQSSGNATASGSATSSTLQVKNAGGTVIATASDTGFAVSAGGSAIDTISFAGGYQIAAGTSETFRIFATTAPGSGASPQNQIAVRLGAPASFTWTDVNGNASGLTGSLIPSAAYPAASAVIHN